MRKIFEKSIKISAQKHTNSDELFLLFVGSNRFLLIVTAFSRKAALATYWSSYISESNCCFVIARNTYFGHLKVILNSIRILTTKEKRQQVLECCCSAACDYRYLSSIALLFQLVYSFTPTAFVFCYYASKCKIKDFQ